MSRRVEPAGWDRSIEALPTVEALLRVGRERDLHLGAQLYVSVDGAPVADVAIGEARPGVALEPTDIVPWTCVSKVITATLVGRAWEHGLVDLDTPVADYLPEFAANGKEAITPRHILLHNSGIDGDQASIVFARPWDDVIEWVCNVKPVPGRPPGRVFHYVRETTWYVLAEIVRRAFGVDDYPAYVRETVFEPLGMVDSWMAMSTEQFRSYGSALIPVQGMSPYGAVPYSCMQNDPFLAPRCSPGQSGRGPMREHARIYESLLGVGGRTPIVSPETVRVFTTPCESDPRQRVEWGLGIKADTFGYRPNRLLYPQDTFGHDGLDSVVCLGDRRHGMAAVVAFNGQPRRAGARGSPGLLRQQLYTAALYRDLGLPLFDASRSERLDLLDRRLDAFIAQPAGARSH